jgi:hypothetical protein
MYKATKTAGTGKNKDKRDSDADAGTDIDTKDKTSKPMSMSVSELISKASPEEIAEIINSNKAIQDAIHKKAMKESNEIGKHEMIIFPQEDYQKKRKSRLDKTGVTVVKPGTGIGGVEPVYKYIPKWQLQKLLESGFMLKKDHDAFVRGASMVTIYDPEGKPIPVPPQIIQALLKQGYTYEKPAAGVTKKATEK